MVNLTIFAPINTSQVDEEEEEEEEEEEKVEEVIFSYNAAMIVSFSHILPNSSIFISSAPNLRKPGPAASHTCMLSYGCDLTFMSSQTPIPFMNSMEEGDSAYTCSSGWDDF